jgi:hypothetical protein
MSDMTSHFTEIVVLTLTLGIYVAIGCFMWSVASSLKRISRDVALMANHRSLEREANRRRSEELHPPEPKPVHVDTEWPVTP